MQISINERQLYEQEKYQDIVCEAFVRCLKPQAIEILWDKYTQTDDRCVPKAIIMRDEGKAPEDIFLFRLFVYNKYFPNMTVMPGETTTLDFTPDGKDAYVYVVEPANMEPLLTDHPVRIANNG